MRVVLFSIFLFCAMVCGAQNVVISGKSQSYSGQKLEVFRHKDFISELAQKLGECIVDSEGNFKLSFTVDKITKIYIPSGRFIVEYLAYPGMNDTVLLPRYWEKPNDMYFVARKVWAKNSAVNSKDLNSLIFDFDRDLKGYNSKFANRIATKDANVLNDIIPLIESKYKSDNAFFNTYKQYSLAMTEFMIYADYPKKIIDKFFKGKKLYADNPAYTDLFRKVFYKHVDFYRFKKRPGIKGSDICNELNSTIKEKGIESGQISNFVLLNLLKDACYSPIIKQQLIFDALEYFRDNCTDAMARSVAENVLAKTTKLAKGYEAPVISGYDINGNTISTADLKGKYLYICFYRAGNPRCISDLKAINSIARANNYLKVLFVCDKTKKPACVNDLKNVGMQNNIIFCDDIAKLKETFKVLVYPSYFLIGKDGNFLKSHTAKPDSHLFKQLNLIKIKEIREGNIKENKLFK